MVQSKLTFLCCDIFQLATPSGLQCLQKYKKKKGTKCHCKINIFFTAKFKSSNMQCFSDVERQVLDS